MALGHVEFSREGSCLVHVGTRFLPTSTLKSDAARSFLTSVTPLPNGDKTPPPPNRVNMTLGHRETRLELFVVSLFSFYIRG